MYINSGQVAETGASARANTVSNGSGVSGAFMETLNRQMIGWITATKDGKVTTGEQNSINNDPFRSLDDLSEQEQGKTIYEGAAATFYTSFKINEITNLMSWMIKFLNIQKELNDKIASALGA